MKIWLVWFGGKGCVKYKTLPIQNCMKIIFVVTCTVESQVRVQPNLNCCWTVLCRELGHFVMNSEQFFVTVLYFLTVRTVEYKKSKCINLTMQRKASHPKNSNISGSEQYILYIKFSIFINFLALNRRIYSWIVRNILLTWIWT